MKTYTDTIEPATEAATESDEQRHARYRRERHAALMSTFEELTDLVADAGPDASMPGDVTRISMSVGIFDGTVAEQMHRLRAIAQVLGVEIEEHPYQGDIQFWARKEFPAGIEYRAYVIAHEHEIAEAKAALAAERITVDYRVEHDSTLAAEVHAALAGRGVDARTDLEDEDPDRASVTTAATGGVVLTRGEVEFGTVFPRLEDCMSVTAYADALAAWLRGAPLEEIQCPARPVHAARGVHSDGSVVTVHTCHSCDDGVDALIERGFTMVRLRPGQVPETGVACGERIEVRV